MARKKACKSCKILYEEAECPICKSTQQVLNWKGRISILDSNRSEIAKKMGISVKGEYAIKVT